ncbi:MAG: hypothetical protein F6K35_35825 [Okeania sp. SIO2H7]|nr:hypothetical protein [Okeania sp. SIO2H7]
MPVVFFKLFLGIKKKAAIAIAKTCTRNCNASSIFGRCCYDNIARSDRSYVCGC